MEDTDGDGVLETVIDHQSGSLGTPIALESPPSSIAAWLELTTGGTTYSGAVSAAGTDVTVDCPPDWMVEAGTRGENYTSTSIEYQQCFHVSTSN